MHAIMMAKLDVRSINGQSHHGTGVKTMELRRSPRHSEQLGRGARRGSAQLRTPLISWADDALSPPPSRVRLHKQAR